MNKSKLLKFQLTWLKYQETGVNGKIWKGKKNPLLHFPCNHKNNIDLIKLNSRKESVSESAIMKNHYKIENKRNTLDK